LTEAALSLADHLAPVVDRNRKSIISAEEVARVKADWRKADADAHTEYAKMKMSNVRFVEKSYDPHECVAPICFPNQMGILPQGLAAIA
jgi:hypothetical protein